MPESLTKMKEMHRARVVLGRIAAVAVAAVVDTMVVTVAVAVAVVARIASVEDTQAEVEAESASSGEDILPAVAVAAGKLFVYEVGAPVAVEEGIPFVQYRWPGGSVKAGATGVALGMEETAEVATVGDTLAGGPGVRATAEVEPRIGWGPLNEVDAAAEVEPSAGLGLPNIECCTC